MTSTVALIMAAGRGRRAGAELPKQYHELAGVSLLRRSVAAFIDHPGIDGVRVVIHADDRDLYDAAVAGLALMTPVIGGAERQDSARLGLESLAEDGVRQVLIHDAARPLVSATVISGVLEALKQTPGAAPALPVVDSLKRRDADDRLIKSVDRNGLWRIQTPQGFHFAPILEAHRAAVAHSHTDDTALFEAMGLPVTLTPGEEQNIKITSQGDLEQARRLQSQAIPPREYRVGFGLDVHGFKEGNTLTLCGVTIPFERSLSGHSDADVALHALTDALLGAIGAGDIGAHFPPSEAKWRGADSAIFLAKALEEIKKRDGRLVNVDITLICQEPKIAPHRDAMIERLAILLGLAPERLSVKGTTSEKLGFTGRREGIVAQAVATVSLPIY